MAAEALQQIRAIVEELIAEPESVPFRTAVDWQAMELLDYPSIVKHPMDLGTVLAKIDRGEYTAPGEAAFDVRLTWENCKLYNHESSDIYQLAADFARRFEEALVKAGVGDDVAADVIRPASQLEKTKFSENIYLLSSLQLGQLVELLDHQCESAIDKSNPEELEISIDAIDHATFHVLDRFVKKCVPEELRNKKKPSKRKSSGGGSGSKKSKTESS